MNNVKLFKQIYKKEPSDVSYCSYRVCPLGAHVDHQHGKVLGIAIDKGVSIAYAPKQNGVVELTSMQFEKRAQFHVNAVPKQKECDWADYLRGATLILSEKYRLNVGVCGVIEGTLPIGGLSSSAAVTISFLQALCKVNNLEISQKELVCFAVRAENEYVGVSTGKLDQSTEVYAKKDCLLYLDTLNDTYELIAKNENMKPFKIAVFFSGLERNLTASNYNLRKDECVSAAYALKAYEGVENGKFKETNLRQVPYETYLKHKDKLPTSWQKRAEHYYTEEIRVEKGVEAFKKGDLIEFGKLCFESGLSSIENYEVGSPELITLYNIMKNTNGIYGGRFSGAGFKGCCMALIDPLLESEILSKVEEEYLKVYPEFKGKFSAHICESADGISL